MFCHRLALAMLAVVTMLSMPAAAQSPNWTQVGSLMCKVNPNVGFIIFGHQPMECTFTPSLAAAPPQYYDGAINTVGLDVGVSAGSILGGWRLRPNFRPSTALAARFNSCERRSGSVVAQTTPCHVEMMRGTISKMSRSAPKVNGPVCNRTNKPGYRKPCQNPNLPNEPNDHRR